MDIEAITTPADRDKMQKLTALVGDQGSENFSRDITRFKDFLIKELSKHNNPNDSQIIRKHLIKHLTQSIRLLSGKARTYAFSASLLLENWRVFIESLVDSTFTQMIQDINECNFNCIFNEVLFFTEATNVEVLHPLSFISLVNILVRQAEKGCRIIKEELVYILLTIFPFVSRKSIDSSPMEFKNVFDDIEKLFRSVRATRSEVVTQTSSPISPSNLEQAFKVFMHYSTAPKSLDLLDQGYQDLISDKSLKSIRKNFEYAGDSVPRGINTGTAVFKSNLNYVFLDLFKSHYDEQGFSESERYHAGLFVYHIFSTVRNAPEIFYEKIGSFDYKKSKVVSNQIIVDIVLAEITKTFQTTGNLTFYVTVISCLVNTEKFHSLVSVLHQGLKKFVPYVNNLTYSGLDNLALWFAHLRANVRKISAEWMQPLLETSKGKYLIVRFLRNLMQIGGYTKLNECADLSDFISLYPADPTPVCVFSNASHPRATDHQMILEKVVPAPDGKPEEMLALLNSNELSCYGEELQDLFLQTLFSKSQ